MLMKNVMTKYAFCCSLIKIELNEDSLRFQNCFIKAQHYDYGVTKPSLYMQNLQVYLQSICKRSVENLLVSGGA